MEICVEMTKISGGHFGKWLPFALYGFIYAKTGTTIFLLYNNAYVVIEIMIIRCLDAEINLRKDKNRWQPFCFRDKSAMALYLKIFIRPYSITVPNFKFLLKVHNSLKLCVFLSHYEEKEVDEKKVLSGKDILCEEDEDMVVTSIFMILSLAAGTETETGTERKCL